MARFDFGKGTVERNMFNDLWEYCQKFWVVEDSKAYWEDLIKATDELEEKYHNSLLNSWMADFISQKELEFHEMKGDTYGEDGKTNSTM